MKIDGHLPELKQVFLIRLRMTCKSEYISTMSFPDHVVFCMVYVCGVCVHGV